MLIGVLAQATDVTTKTVRFWEAEGLVPPPARTRSGYRDYPDGAVDRVRFIVAAQAAGLALRQIAEILAIRDEGQPPCRHAADLVGQRLDDIDRRIAELGRMRESLQHVQDRLDVLDPGACVDAVVCSAITPADRGVAAISHDRAMFVARAR